MWKIHELSMIFPNVIPNFCQHFLSVVTISKNFFGMKSDNMPFVPVWRCARAEQYAKLNKLVMPNKLRKRRPVTKKNSIEKIVQQNNSDIESESFNRRQFSRFHIGQHMLSFRCNAFIDHSYYIRIRFVILHRTKVNILLLKIKLHLLCFYSLFDDAVLICTTLKRPR